MQSIFGFIIHPMEVGVVWLAVEVGSAGIGIILFTIAIRLILAPLNIAQLRNAKKMQALQPHIAALKKTHGKDRQAMATATQNLYKEHGVNPALGCLPMILQIPILLGLFYALMHLGTTPTALKGHPNLYSCNGHNVDFHAWLQGCYSVKGAVGSMQQVYDLFHANFLWLSHGLGHPDPLYILPLLAGITQWIQSRMMLTKSSDPQQQMMNSMMNFMPLMIIFFATRYASGLSLYWVTSTLIGIAIQYRITGWGLLLPTLASVRNYVLSSGPNDRPAPKPRQETPKSRQDSPSGNGAKPAQRTPSTPKVEANGQDGAGSEDGKTMTPVVRPRRTANRPRGGRRGGRRG